MSRNSDHNSAARIVDKPVMAAAPDEVEAELRALGKRA
jgi:hypothetical protein